MQVEANTDLIDHDAISAFYQPKQLPDYEPMVEFDSEDDESPSRAQERQL